MYALDLKQPVLLEVRGNHPVYMRVRLIQVLDDALKVLPPLVGEPSDRQGAPLFVLSHLLRIVLDLGDGIGPASDADRDDRAVAPQLVPALVNRLIGARRGQCEGLYRRPAKQHPRFSGLRHVTARVRRSDHLVADIAERRISLLGAPLVGAAAGVYVHAKELVTHGEYSVWPTMVEAAASRKPNSMVRYI